MKKPVKISKLHFNSTMVRLKVTDIFTVAVMIWIFQFHYGTIKSLDSKDNLFGYSRFQFHYGTIKSNCFASE